MNTAHSHAAQYINMNSCIVIESSYSNTFDITNEPTGVYFVKLTNESGSTICKIIKQ